MNQKQLNEMKETIKESYKYKAYLWEQAQLFYDTPTDSNYVDYSTRYYQQQDIIEGMLRIYSIAIGINKVDTELYFLTGLEELIEEETK